MMEKRSHFICYPLEHIQGETKTFSSLSVMLDRYYFGKAERDRVKQQGHDLERFIANEIEKNRKKIEKLERTLAESEQRKSISNYMVNY